MRTVIYFFLLIANITSVNGQNYKKDIEIQYNEFINFEKVHNYKGMAEMINQDYFKIISKENYIKRKIKKDSISKINQKDAVNGKDIKQTYGFMGEKSVIKNIGTITKIGNENYVTITLNSIGKFKKMPNKNDFYEMLIKHRQSYTFDDKNQIYTFVQEFRIFAKSDEKLKKWYFLEDGKTYDCYIAKKILPIELFH